MFEVLRPVGLVKDFSLQNAMSRLAGSETGMMAFASVPMGVDGSMDLRYAP